MRVMSIVAVSLILLLAANAANADDYKKQNVTRTVMSGIKTKIGQHYHINGDCTAAPMPPTKVIKSPSHGKIEIVNEKIYPKSSGRLEK